ncbi:hypothetical protein [Flavobacterium sp.]|uniref:hypothetical protein n=1 Tax=Flavobacterium sp. TaxID=239 RepID=UPI003D0F1823
MKKNIYEELTNEKLIKKRDLFKGVSIGFGVIFALAIVIIIYLFTVKGFKNVSIATLIPVFTLPITFVPLLINLNLLNKEIKSRNL